MVSCYDCELFGTDCPGIVPPIEYRDRIHDYCRRYKAVGWRRGMHKPDGRTRL